MATAKKTYNCEAIVLGGNLTGLLVAEALRQSGKEVRIFDSNSQLGLPHRPIAGKVSPMKADVGFYPDDEKARASLAWLQDLLRFPMDLTSEEVGPVHFEEGQLKSFLGFGDHSFPSRDEIDFYTSPRRLLGTEGLGGLTQELAKQWQERGHIPKETTKFFIENGRLAAVEFNGDEVWSANTIISTLPISEMLELIPVDAIDGKNRTRLGKTATWTSVALHALHAQPLSEERGLHILFGNGQEVEPIVGRLWKAEEDSRQQSVWMTLVSKEALDDSDQLGHALKHLKRQVRRAYPNAFDGLVDEKVVVTSESHGHLQLKTADTFTFSELNGLVMASPLLSPFKGSLGAIDVAHRVWTSFENNYSAKTPVAAL